MPLLFPLVVAALLFAIGVYAVLVRRNAILVLMGVELMLNAVNLNLLAFDAWHRDALHAGQILTLFTITIAAAEIGLGLAIVLLVFRTRGQVDVDAVRELADRDQADEHVAEAERAERAELTARAEADRTQAEGDEVAGRPEAAEAGR